MWKHSCAEAASTKVMGWQLALMIIEVFSSLNDSMILSGMGWQLALMIVEVFSNFTMILRLQSDLATSGLPLTLGLLCLLISTGKGKKGASLH